MPIVRLPGGDLRDEIRQPLYDTLTIANTAAGFTGAGIPAGVVGASAADMNGQQFFSNIQGKAKWQTNMLQPNLLQTAVSFRLQGMSMDAAYINVENSVATATPPAVQGILPALMEFGSLRLRIGEKDYWEGPLGYLMGRLEQNGAISSTDAAVAPASRSTALLYQRAGNTAVQGIVLAGRHVVDINPLQAFFGQVSVNVPASLLPTCTFSATSNDYINVKFSFKGLLRRPVQ